MASNEEMLQVPKKYIVRLVELASKAYSYDNSELNQLKGYIEAIGMMHDIKAPEEEKK